MNLFAKPEKTVIYIWAYANLDFYIHAYADGSPRSCKSGLPHAKSKLSVLRLQTWRKELNSAWLYRSQGQACKDSEGHPGCCLAFTNGNATSAAISIVWSSCWRSQGPTAPKLPWRTVHFWRSPASLLPWLGLQEKKHKMILSSQCSQLLLMP